MSDFLDIKILSGLEQATNFVYIAMPRGRPRAERLASGAIAFDIDKKFSSGLSRKDQKDEKAVRQQDGLFFQGRIVPTEFEKDHQNFLAKSYWPAKGSVKEFLENRYLCFQ